MNDVKSGDDEELSARDRFLVLLRHGLAEEKSEDKEDEDRSLTPEGHARMKQIGRGLERAFPKAQAIYSSPLLRAVQTALWVSKGYRSRIKVNTTDALIPGATYEEFQQFLAGIPERRVVIVGHEPNLSDNLTELIGLAGHEIELKKGGCYGVRLKTEGGAVLEWLLSPRILRRLAEGE
ncbi:MAG TPA: histidine phosphatase family protein [Thermoanaerobaculia bacterium]